MPRKPKVKQVVSDLLDTIRRPSVDAPDLIPAQETKVPENQCPSIQAEVKPPVFVLLGRYEELIQMFPAFLAIYNRTGIKPVVVVSAAYAGVFEGISYAIPHIIPVDWYAGLPTARSIAEQLSGGLTNQSWHLGNPVTPDVSGAFILQTFGNHWGADVSIAPSYGVWMWNKSGFNAAEMMSFTLIFDQRNPSREQELIRQVQLGNRQKKPLLLYNFVSAGNPFGYTPEVQRVMQPLHDSFYMVDLVKCKPDKIYDLIGLFEAAALMVTIDAAPLHLAAACQMPYAAFTMDGWLGSVPKGNCIFQTKYSIAKEQLPQFKEGLLKISLTK